jgi:sporulation protein YlmC with PRC-barrel domain
VKKSGGVASALAVSVLLAVPALAADPSSGEQAGGGLMFTSRALVGQELRLADGRRAGSIAELVIGATSGRIEIVVVEVDGVTVAVPWSKVKVGRNGALTLQSSRIDLVQAPEIVIEPSERTASAQP